MSSVFMPWGNIDWIISKIPEISKWSFLGCISTEDRCLAPWEWLLNNNKLDYYEMWRINDFESHLSPYSSIASEIYEKQIAKYNTFSGGVNECFEFNLLDSDEHASKQFNNYLERTKGNIIIDISTFPKRWFFPIVKDSLQNNRVKNLLVIYTHAMKYSDVQGEDPMSWRYFPSFGEKTSREAISKYYIIAAGYQPLSLPDWIGGVDKPKVYIVFPFPASVSGYSRVWDFIRAIESDCGDISVQHIKYVSGFDLPEIYKSISEIISLEGSKEPILLPYGPKPISLAFSMLASQLTLPVGYTQPLYYNPSYSEGFQKTSNDVPKTTAYLLKANGHQLYCPPTVDYE